MDMDLYKNLESVYNDVVAELTNKVIANGGEIKLSRAIRVVNVEDYDTPIEVRSLRVKDGDLQLGCDFAYEDYDTEEDEEYDGELSESGDFLDATRFLNFHIEDLLYIDENID